MKNKVNHASYHHEVCQCGDPWCHGCPTNEEFHTERDEAGRIDLSHRNPKQVNEDLGSRGQLNGLRPFNLFKK